MKKRKNNNWKQRSKRRENKRINLNKDRFKKNNFIKFLIRINKILTNLKKNNNKIKVDVT